MKGTAVGLREVTFDEIKRRKVNVKNQMLLLNNNDLM